MKLSEFCLLDDKESEVFNNWDAFKPDIDADLKLEIVEEFILKTQNVGLLGHSKLWMICLHDFYNC